MEYHHRTFEDNSTDSWFRISSTENVGVKRQRGTECNSSEEKIAKLQKNIEKLEQRLKERESPEREEEKNEKLVKVLEEKVERLEGLINKKVSTTLPLQIVHGTQKKIVQDGRHNSGHKLRKPFDDTLRELYVQQYSTIMQSVGCLNSQNGKGTLFRVGSKYGMTAAHVINAIINPHRQPKGDEARLCRDQVYVSFSEAGADQSKRFKLAGRVEFCDNTLDVAIVEFSEESIGKLPPPLSLLKYDALTSQNDVAVVGYGHSHNDFKCVEHSVRVVDPESVPVSDIREYLKQNHQILKPVLKRLGKDYTTVDDGYTGYNNKHHVLLNAFVGPGASGSPILTKDDPAALQVVGLYTCGYPNFYYQLPSTIQYPMEWTFEAGTKMSFIYDAMESQNKKLAEDIFSG